MKFNFLSYILGFIKGKSEGSKNVVIEGGINCTDANTDGNIVITEVE